MSTQLATQGYGGNQELATVGYGLAMETADADDILEFLKECCAAQAAAHAEILAAIAALAGPSLNRTINVSGDGEAGVLAAVEDLRRLINLYRKELQENRFNSASARDRFPGGPGKRRKPGGT